MEKFIEAVRAHPCLWNPQRTNDAWKVVVDQVNMKCIPNIQKAKSEWKRLRDNHRDALKRAKLGKNKLLPAQVTTWKYAKAMQFLEPYMKYRITEEIEPEATPGASTVTFADFEVSTTEAPASPDAKRRRLAPDSLNAIDRSIKTETDSLQSFYDCILQSTREMPQFMQIQVKKKIFGIIIEAEEIISSQSQQSHDVAAEQIKIEIKKEMGTHDTNGYEN